MKRVEFNSKITASHLARKAVVYLRQSSLAQVKHNTESQRLQYALKDTAKAYGFARVEVIDTDLGMSASSGAQTREGFKQWLASIALSEVGMVLSREPARLSTDKDWCQLMELCRVLNTLIGDAESVYDLNRLDDQLILGIKGTLSVVELGTLKLRLQQGREAKARRGELGRSPQPGYVMDEATHRLVKDPNLRVQEAIALVFSRFEALGSLRQTHLWFHQERIELPVNKPLGGHFRLAWKLPSPSFLGDMLNNPMYAGAYVYGRRPSEVVVREGQAVKRAGRPRAAQEASVFIAQHHEAYVSWEVYQRNLDTLRGNGSNFAQDDAAQVVRGGQGLLSGLLRCARCGRKLNIRYWGKQGTAARYLCSGDFQTGGRYCLGFGGATVDRRLSEVILNALSPYGLQASIAAIAQSHSQGSERRGVMQRQLQRSALRSRAGLCSVRSNRPRQSPSGRGIGAALEREAGRAATR